MNTSSRLAFKPNAPALGPTWACDLAAEELSKRRLLIDADFSQALEGWAMDVQGKLWCRFGAAFNARAEAPELDGVHLGDAPGGRAHIQRTEPCANRCLGAAKSKRLFMASRHWPYALRAHSRAVL